MSIQFSTSGWEDYLYWQNSDKKVVVKINNLIKEILRSPYEGIGKPEALRHELSGWWSRRINEEHRLVYRLQGDILQIAQCRHHY